MIKRLRRRLSPDSKEHVIKRLQQNDQELKSRLQMLEKEARVLGVRADG